MYHEKRGGPGQGNRPSSPQQDKQKTATHRTTEAHDLSASDLVCAGIVWAIWFVIVAAGILSLCALAWVVA